MDEFTFHLENEIQFNRLAMDIEQNMLDADIKRFNHIKRDIDFFKMEQLHEELSRQEETDIALCHEFSAITTNIIKIPVSKGSKIAKVKGWQKLKKSAEVGKNDDVAYKTGEDAGFFVLDIDHPKPNKNEKDGYKKWLNLNKKYNINTKTVRSKNKGLHLYFKYDPELKQTTKINGFSIDIRSNGGYIMSPESEGYEIINDTEITTIPFELKKWIMPHYVTVKKTKKGRTKKKTKNVKSKYIFLYDKTELKLVLKNLDKKYLNNRSEWLKVTAALKSENLYKIWDKWSSKSASYDQEGNDKVWENMKPEVDINYINQLSEIELTVTKTMKLNLFTQAPTETRDEKYINLDNFDYMNNRTLLIKSATGTGKTTATVKMINAINEEQPRKVLSIVSRVSLAQQHHKNFNDNGIKIKNYMNLDEKHLNDCDKLVIQLDSIVKLNWKKWRNCILYIDEINSLIDYMLNSTTLRSKRMQIWNTLNFMIKTCGFLIGVDADISDNVMSLFSELDEAYYLIHNKYMNCKDKPATHYSDKNKVISIMKNKLKNGEYFVACFDSLRDQNIVIEELKQYCERKKLDCKQDFLIYSSRDGDDDSLKNVSMTWTEKYVFYSPKIVYGLDFNNKVPVDVFFMSKSTSVNPLQFSQMVARTRNIKTLHYYIEEHNTPLDFDTVGDVKEYFEDMTSHYDETVKACDDEDDEFFEKKDLKKMQKMIDGMRYMQVDERTGEAVYANKIYEKLFYQSYHYDQIMRSAMTWHFERILQEKGYVIAKNKQKSKHAICEKKLKADVEENNNLKVERILNDKEESLSSSEKKIKEQMQKRAELLQVELDNADYQDEITDDRKFVNHLNVSSLLMNNIDEKLVTKSYQDCRVNNVKGNIMKIKLIKQLEEKLGFKESLTIEYDTDKARFAEVLKLDDKYVKTIQKTFRSKKEPSSYKDSYYMLIGMYRNICKGVVTSKKLSNNDYKYSVSKDVITRNLDLVLCRNKKLTGYNEKAYGYTIQHKTPKRIV